MQGSTRRSESDVRFLNSVIIVIVLALALVPKEYVTNATIISTSQSSMKTDLESFKGLCNLSCYDDGDVDVIATGAEQRNAMTCLTPEGTRDDSNNCIQVIQAKFNRPYQKVFNNSLEFRLIYSYTDVIITSYITWLYCRSFYKLIKAGSDLNMAKKEKQKFLFFIIIMNIFSDSRTKLSPWAWKVQMWLLRGRFCSSSGSRKPSLHGNCLSSIHKQDTMNSFKNMKFIHFFY